MKAPKIIQVPKKMQKFYGSGTMLHPSLEMISILVDQIPKGNITTISHITSKLSKDFGTDITCPMRTGNHLKKLSKNSNFQYPFWRVVRSNGLMVKFDNYTYWANILEKEGLN